MPRRGKTVPEVVALSRVHSRRALKTLVGIMTQPRANARARIRAANAVLDIGWGKPKRASIYEDEGEPSITVEIVKSG